MENKELSIKQRDKLLINLHSDVLKTNFPETLQIFESNSNVVLIPEEIGEECIEPIVRYFYFREINPISLDQTFNLLNLAIFLEVKPLINEIQEFVSVNENEAQEILKLSLNSFLLFQKSNHYENLLKILSGSINFLLKSKKTNEIFDAFNFEFFKKLENNKIVEKSLNFFIEIIKTSNCCSNEILMEFLVLYNDRLVEYFKTEDKNFNMENYVKRFIYKNLNLVDFDLKKIQLSIEKSNWILRLLMS